jgi:uncharacterized protein YcaQ
MSSLKIPNKDARRLWLASHGLRQAPTGKSDALGTIEALGFVQLDTIQVIARAHHHILWSRDQTYREPVLNKLLSKDRAVFEHFTHDASVLPMAYLSMWQRQFRRMKEKVERSSWFGNALPRIDLDAILRRITDEGPLSTKDFETKPTGKRDMWERPSHKVGLDYLWYSGQLATCHRDGFIKYYDLAERVFPDQFRAQTMADKDQIDWLCDAALLRLGFGTLGEIRKFWDATAVAEVSDWARRRADGLVPVKIEDATGNWTPAYACAEIETRLAQVGSSSSRLRILNPFDPAIRDRLRLKRLFGFEYTVEMFVPEAKRKWGYYIYPLLDADRFVGRLEAKAMREKDVLNVTRIWWEPGVQVTENRLKRLKAEVKRLARLAGVSRVNWMAG